MLDDIVEGHVQSVIYRPVGCVGELHGVQEWVVDVFRLDRTRHMKDFITTEVRAIGL